MYVTPSVNNLYPTKPLDQVAEQFLAAFLWILMHQFAEVKPQIPVSTHYHFSQPAKIYLRGGGASAAPCQAFLGHARKANQKRGQRGRPADKMAGGAARHYNSQQAPRAEARPVRPTLGLQLPACPPPLPVSAVSNKPEDPRDQLIPLTTAERAQGGGGGCPGPALPAPPGASPACSGPAPAAGGGEAGAPRPPRRGGGSGGREPTARSLGAGGGRGRRAAAGL